MTRFSAWWNSVPVSVKGRLTPVLRGHALPYIGESAFMFSSIALLGLGLDRGGWWILAGSFGFVVMFKFRDAVRDERLGNS